MKAPKLALALLFAGLAGPAAAQDRDPTILEVLLNNQKATEGPIGAVLMLRGKNFHLCPDDAPKAGPPGLPPEQPPPGNPKKDDKPKVCRHEEVKVRIGGTECMLLSANPEFVSFIVPHTGVSPGRTRIRLEIEKKKSTEVDFTILTLEQWEKKSDKDKKAQIGMEEGAPIPGQEGSAQPTVLTPAEEEDIRGKFGITRFELKRDVGANRFEIEGKTSDLPDGFSVSVVLQFEDPGQAPRQIDAKRVNIANKSFSVIFGPYTKELLYGNYAATLLFEVGKQGQLKARRWVSSLSDRQKEIYERIQRREYLQVGTPQEVADQRKLIQDHYLAYTKACQKQLDEFEAAFGCACRSFFRNPGGAGFDEARYLDYLKQTLAIAPEVADKIKKDQRFATNQGHFKPKEYEDWATKTFIPGLQQAYQQHLDFKGKFIAPLDEKADQYADYLASIVLSLFRDWSRATYDRAKISFPSGLATVAINPITSPTVSKQYFHVQRRQLLRKVGLNSVVAAEEAAEAAKQNQ